MLQNMIQELVYCGKHGGKQNIEKSELQRKSAPTWTASSTSSAALVSLAWMS